MKLALPINEKRRLEVLWQYNVLDTPAESAFDDLTELAAQICGAPIATITFVDEHRQWFKSRIGLDKSETSRDISFCSHAILESELLIVPDATLDKRFAKNSLVTSDPKIRFYAGAPLINSEGYALGTICVIDKVPRKLSAAQQRSLELLARHVVALLEMKRGNEGAVGQQHLLEGKYQKIFENALIGIFRTSPAGRYLEVNPALARILGYESPEELVTALTDLGTQLYADAGRRKEFTDLIESQGSVHDFQAQYFRKDGSRIWVKTTAQVVRDRAGKTLYYEGVIQDITAQITAEKQMRESEAQYRMLFDGNPHPMWVFDQETLRFLEVNDAAILHYGFSRDEFLAMTIRDIRPPEDVPALTDYYSEATKGEWNTGLLDTNVWRHRKKNGTIIEVEVKWTRIEFKGTKASLVLANDVTERRQDEFQNATFTRLAHRLSSASSAEEAARIIVDAAEKLLGWDSCSLDLFTSETNTIQPVLGIDLIDGEKKDVPPAYESSAPSPHIAEVIRKGGSLVLRNDPTSTGAPGLRSFGNSERLSASLLFVPIRNVTKVIGILSIQSYSQNAYSEKSLRVLQTLADQCGGALERISVEQKLAKERNLLRTLLDHLPDHIFVKDLESRHLLINKAQYKLRGLTDQTEVIGQTLLEVSPPEVGEQFIRDDQEVFRTGQPLIDREEQVIDGAGNIHWMLTTKVPLRDKDGKITGLVGISRDITERKRIESALRETEEIFHLISENVSDLIAVIDATGHRLYNSPSYKQIFHDSERLKGSDSFAQIHPEDQQRVREVFEETLRTGIGQRIEYRFLLSDGTIRHIESQGNFVRGDSPELNKIVVVSRDISERKRVEQRSNALSTLGQKLSAATSPKEAARVISETALGLFSWDLFVMNLFSLEDFSIQPILNIDTVDGRRVEVPDDRAGTPPSPFALRVIHEGAQLILKEPPLSMLPGTFPIGDTTRPSASLMYAPIRNGTTVIGILSIQSYSLNAYNQQDLVVLQTIADHCGGSLERIRAEEALRSSEVRFHSVWENSVDGMRLTDENGIIVTVNEAFCKLVNMQRKELEGQPFTVTYATSENRESLLQRYKERFRDHTVAKFFERKMTFRSGKTAELGGANSFVDLKGQRPLLLGLFRDITEQKRLETQLRQSQKMESIGQLAGGIAHDFNNLLTVIQGHASLLIATEKSAETADSLQQISMAAERSANLTRQLLTFSRRQVMQPRNLDLKEVVDEMIKMLRRILGEDIVLKVENSADLPRIHADRGMMEQILLNLAVNSRDAMPRGGELVISTNPVRIDENYTRENHEAYLGEFVCLTVTDTGCGMAPETLAHIFEPFFTTKEIGKGTGLGLATVYGIVKQHEGWISVTSELDKGTSFKIFFPRSTEPIETHGPSAIQKSPRGSETILVVEDETPLRELVQFILERQGYHVLEAASGVAALEVWAKHKESIDLLLTDLVMPEGITGSELSVRLQGEDPDLKVIFTSGYSADTVGKDFVLRDGINFLQKPYHPDKLAQTVRDCLDGK